MSLWEDKKVEMSKRNARLYRCYLVIIGLCGLLTAGLVFYSNIMAERRTGNILANSSEVLLEDAKLYPVGCPVGIYLKSKGVLIVEVSEFTDNEGKVCSPCRDLLQTGDYILAVNGQEISQKQEFIKLVEECGGSPVSLQIERGNERIICLLKPVKDVSNKYKLGLWVRDNTQGVGTITFVDEYGNFAALGHGINDIDTTELLKITGGSLYKTDIIEYDKAKKDKPGEMIGVVKYSDDQIIGKITDNNPYGIFGKSQYLMERVKDTPAFEAARKEDVHKGSAYVLCSLSYDEASLYKINITKLNKNSENKEIEFEVVDRELLNITGGIIQGMSGSPIIQDDKIVGAVTHVLVQDSSKGYGIFIENMINKVKQ